MRRIGILVVCLLVVLGFYGKRRLLGWTWFNDPRGRRARPFLYRSSCTLAFVRWFFFNFSTIGGSVNSESCFGGGM